MAELGRPAKVAIGFAIVALLTSLVAVIVVMRRSTPVSTAAAKSVAPIDLTIAADLVTKLKRDVVEKATDDKGNVIGVTVADDTLRTALGFETGDVITAIGGRAIKREFDVYDAVLGMSMMDASIVYVEIVREQAPMLLRWKLDGDLRSARRDATPRPRSGGMLGGGGLATTPNPFTAPADPLIDTIRKIDEMHYEVPRSTVERMFANPDRYLRGARVVPAIRRGRPDGMRFYAIRPDSVFAAVGLANGDTVRSINGVELTSIDKVLEVFTKIHDTQTLELGIVPRGSSSQETVVITIK